MEIDSKTLDPVAAYRLLVGIVVPRPIAWVTTIGEGGRVNAAPFSCYTFVSKAPPMIAINIGRRGPSPKDTATNIRAAGEFVVNVVTAALVKPMHDTSAEYPPEVSEVETLGLETLPSRKIRPPRIAASPIHMECKLHRIIELGDVHDQLVIGEVVHFHIRDDLIVDGKIETKRLDPLARLGGPQYANLGEYVTMGFTSEFGAPAKPES